MDRNFFTAIFLMLILTAGYYYFLSKTAPPQEIQEKAVITQETESITSETSEPLEQLSPTESDSTQKAKLVDRFSDFYTLVEGEEQITEIKTEELTVHISNKGGNVVGIWLNNHTTYDSLPLPVIKPHEENEFFFQFAYQGGRSIKSSDIFFMPSLQNLEVEGESQKEIVFRAEISPEKAIEQVYTFKGQGFDFGYETRFVGLDREMKNNYYELTWKSALPRTELSMLNMRQKSTIAYRVSSDVEKLGVSNSPESETIKTPIDWISYKSQFFSAILIAENKFNSGQLDMLTPESSDEVNRIMESELYVDLSQNSVKYTFYAGPNEYSTLSSYGLKLEKEMDLGWSFISFINVGTVYIFKFLEQYISNYGFIIIILAFIIRLALFPLTFKSHISMAKMRVINQTPEMKALDEKFKDDPQKLQMAKMKIFREMNVSMLGGCLPMLFSYPFLIALFFFFPQSVELRQKAFLWANDLSTYDSIYDFPNGFSLPGYGDHISLFCLLMAASTFVFTYFQQKSQPTTGANAQLKYIIYFMPLILLIFLNNYAAGLSLYYFVSNLISISQTLLIRMFVNDEVLLKEMREAQKQSKKKNSKGGGGGNNKSRLERWAEKQQKRQQELSKTRQKQNPSSNRSSRRKK